MDIKMLLKRTKIKNIFLTFFEILLVAGIIFGILMFMQHKIDKDADKLSGVSIAKTESQTEYSEVDSDSYYLEINIKKKVVIVYQYSKNKKEKNPYKVFKCSIGKDIEIGKYKILQNYMWLETDSDWHRYNTKISNRMWIHSAVYEDKYPNMLDKSSYNNIGKKRADGKNITLYAKDAEWIYSQCKKGTAVKVVKGKKSDKLPIVTESVVVPYKYCGWDPTDPDEHNPYRKMKKSAIVQGNKEVYVERGQSPKYLSNLLAIDENGKVITGNLKYKKIDTSEIGTKKITYSYKLKNGSTIKTTQKFKIIDTIPPKVSCSKSQFTYEVVSKSEKDMNKESNISDIEKMVRSDVSCNESGVKITVSTVGHRELREGNFPVVIKAQDEAGNVGACQVMCEIKVVKPKKIKRYEPPEELVDELKNKYNKKNKNSKKDKISSKQK